MLQGLQTLRLILLLIGCVAGLFGAFTQYAHATHDPRPYPINVHDFNLQAAEHHWLAVTGRLAPEFGIIRIQRDDHGERCYVDVPVVDAYWRASDAVHVFARFGPYSHDDARRRAADAMHGARGAVCTVTGTQLGLEVARIFPQLHVASDAVILSDGGVPPTPGSAIGLGLLCVALGVFAAWRLKVRFSLASAGEE